MIYELHIAGVVTAQKYGVLISVAVVYDFFTPFAHTVAVVVVVFSVTFPVVAEDIVAKDMLARLTVVVSAWIHCVVI